MKSVYVMLFISLLTANAHAGVYNCSSVDGKFFSMRDDETNVGKFPFYRGSDHTIYDCVRVKRTPHNDFGSRLRNACLPGKYYGGTLPSGTRCECFDGAFACS